MIITILGVLLLIGGILLLNSDTCKHSLIYCGLIGSIIGLVMSVISIVGISVVQLNREIDYQNKLYERDILEYRIENMEEDIVGNEMLYNDIVEFNNELRSVKKWANNPWTNWFNNADIATIDYIELE